jgi:hypothetical protein
MPEKTPEFHGSLGTTRKQSYVAVAYHTIILIRKKCVCIHAYYARENTAISLEFGHNEENNAMSHVASSLNYAAISLKLASCICQRKLRNFTGF